MHGICVMSGGMYASKCVYAQYVTLRRTRLDRMLPCPEQEIQIKGELLCSPVCQLVSGSGGAHNLSDLDPECSLSVRETSVMTTIVLPRCRAH